MQTAVVNISHDGSISSANLLLDSGSQKAYITNGLKEILGLTVKGNESLMIQAFGSSQSSYTKCDIVEVTIEAVSVNFITLSIKNQRTDVAKMMFSEIPVVSWEIHAIGSDHYWKLIKGNAIKSEVGQTAVETVFGWILSGPLLVPEQVKCFSAVNETYVDDETDKTVRTFWDRQAIGVVSSENTVHQEFEKLVKFNGERYEVSLPWNDTFELLSNNYEIWLQLGCNVKEQDIPIWKQQLKKLL